MLPSLRLGPQQRHLADLAHDNVLAVGEPQLDFVDPAAIDSPAPFQTDGDRFGNVSPHHLLGIKRFPEAEDHIGQWFPDFSILALLFQKADTDAIQRGDFGNKERVEALQRFRTGFEHDGPQRGHALVFPDGRGLDMHHGKRVGGNESQVRGQGGLGLPRLAAGSERARRLSQRVA